MLRTLVTCTKTVVRPAYSRGFAEILSIPTDSQQSGRRRLEIDAAAAGVVAFNRDPIIPPQDAGTKENPILVPSGEHSRVVGYEDPTTHSIFWFKMDAGKLHFLPNLGLYFKIKELH